VREPDDVTPTFCAETSMAPTGTEGLVYSGGEDAYPFNEVARPAPRGHLAKTKRATGWLLMQHLAAAAAGAGAAVSADTRVDRLVVDDGRVSPRDAPPPACARSGTPAGSPSATARCSAASPA